jgi:hypothetical protein
MKILLQIEGFSNVDSLLAGFMIEWNDALESIHAFENLSYIGEDLWISENSMLVSINGFTNLKETGYFNIANNQNLESISPFENLSIVNGDLYLNDNMELVSFQGFSKLDSVGGNIGITDYSGSAKLEIIDGFENLTYIGENIWISDLNALRSIEGFNALQRIEGRFNIVDNGSLETIPAFESLSYLGEGLYIGHNPELTHIDGFNSLSYLAFFEIQSNQKLFSITGFDQAIEMNGGIYLSKNDELNDISGFANIDASTISASPNHGDTEISIWNNPNLDDCAIQSLCDYFRQDETNAYISSNRTSCSGAWQIINECTVNTGNTASNKILVYPNPASKNISIESGDHSSLIRVECINMYGQAMSMYPVSNSPGKHTYDLSALNPGIYQMKITFDDHVIWRSVVRL